MNPSIKLLPVMYRRIIGYDVNGKPLEEITSPGLVDIRAYPYLAPYCVDVPEVKPS